jgi:hypothetical protein
MADIGTLLGGLGGNSIGAAIVRLELDTDYGRSLPPGLEAGLYGSSFRGTFENESFDRYPESSPHNPNQLPERTVREVSDARLRAVSVPRLRRCHGRYPFSDRLVA